MFNYAQTKAECVKLMGELDKSGKNAAFYQEMFDSMSNADFDRFMHGLISGENPLSITIPNYDDSVDVTVDNNIALAEKLGRKMFQRIWITDPRNGDVYLTERKHLVYETNVCRQTQTLDHKISTAKDNSEIDELTGQVRGRSKASGFSGPEFMITNSQGLDSVIAEFIKFRGGDLVSNRMMNNQLVKEGRVSMNEIPGASQRSRRSVQTLSAILNGMLFTNNFAG